MQSGGVFHLHLKQKKANFLIHGFSFMFPLKAIQICTQHSDWSILVLFRVIARGCSENLRHYEGLTERAKIFVNKFLTVLVLALHFLLSRISITHILNDVLFRQKRHLFFDRVYKARDYLFKCSVV